MYSHATVGTNDLARAAAFYDAVLTPLGFRRRPVTPDGGPAAAVGPLQEVQRAVAVVDVIGPLGPLVDQREPEAHWIGVRSRCGCSAVVVGWSELPQLCRATRAQ